MDKIDQEPTTFFAKASFILAAVPLCIVLLLFLCYWKFFVATRQSGCGGLAAVGVMGMMALAGIFTAAVSSIIGIVLGLIGVRRNGTMAGRIAILINAGWLLAILTLVVWQGLRLRKSRHAHRVAQAIAQGDAQSLDHLLAKGYDLNERRRSDKQSLLHYAVTCGQKDSISVLLEHEIDVNAEDFRGITPLQLLALNQCKGSRRKKQWDHIAAAELLLAHGARFDFSPAHSREETILHLAVKKGDAALVKLMIDQGTPLEIKNHEQATALGLLAYDDIKDEIVEQLIQAGANPDTQDIYGTTPLHSAVGKKRIRTVKMLLEHSADVHIRDNRGSTPLHRAAKVGTVEIVEMILKAGADVDAIDNHRRTALHAAVFNDTENLVPLLRGYGADIDVKDNTGRTAYNLASNRHVTGRTARIRVLMQEVMESLKKGDSNKDSKQTAP